MNLLLIEDDRDFAIGLKSSLAQSGYAIRHFLTATEALVAYVPDHHDLIILDLGLPDMDGIDALHRIRKRNLRAPVLILTARDGLKDRVNGLNAGADDYLSKPFELAELEARISALLRRSRNDDHDGLKFGALTFDEVERTAFVNGKPLALTAREIAVLATLLERPGRIVSKERIFTSIYDLDTEANSAAIEVYVSRLRKKLDLSEAGVDIRVLRGLGYRLELRSEPPVG